MFQLKQNITVTKVEKIILIKIHTSHLSFTCYSVRFKNKKGALKAPLKYFRMIVYVFIPVFLVAS
jgi:cell division protein FtsL